VASSGQEYRDTANAHLAELERLCVRCVERLPVEAAAVSVMTTKGHRGTVCATNELATRLEEIQFTVGEGPGVEAFTGQAPVLIEDIDASAVRERWPAFAEAAAREGFVSIFVFPSLSQNRACRSAGVGAELRDHGAWPSPIVRWCVTSRCCCRWICGTRCRAITWSGSSSIPSMSWTSASSSVVIGVVPVLLGMTRGSCWVC
jgi:hypothetical protein